MKTRMKSFLLASLTFGLAFADGVAVARADCMDSASYSLIEARAPQTNGTPRFPLSVTRTSVNTAVATIRPNSRLGTLKFDLVRCDARRENCNCKAVTADGGLAAYFQENGGVVTFEIQRRVNGNNVDSEGTFETPPTGGVWIPI